MPFELQGPGTGNAPPMTNLSNSQIDGTNSIPRPGTSIGDYLNQGSGMNLGGGQLLPPGAGYGPRIPQPQILGTNPQMMDPRGLTQEQMMMMNRGGFAEGGMPGYEGGIMDLETGRQQYFLGKLVKKATRAIKKVAKSPFGKALILGGLTFGIPGSGFSGLMGTKSGIGFKKFLGNKILGEATMKQGTKQISGGLLNFIKGNPLKTIAAASGLAGLMTSKQEDDELDRGEGIDIEAIRNSPYRYLAPRFMAKGGKAEPVANETMPLLDIGGKEMDLRAEGGFVPIGRMEKADDVPARLSKNEFVFTADAVRNAGNGSVDKGAEVMYKTMKNLEGGGKISKKSQGLEGIL